MRSLIQEGEGEDDSDFVDDYEETEEETLEEEENIYVISDKPNPTLSKSKNLSSVLVQQKVFWVAHLQRNS